jgi:hypothetical protein
MSAAGPFWGGDVRDHAPVFVEERRGGGRVPAGQFCNYACLARHIEAEGLEDGELVVDRTPVKGRLARSTPELIVEKLADDGEDDADGFYSDLLGKFE